LKIENNIIKEKFKNVLFVCETACGGKITLSKLLAEKHHLFLYDMDKLYKNHRKIADNNYQPNMCCHMKGFHKKWTRPINKQEHHLAFKNAVIDLAAVYP
jgi:hypothetical protein